MTNPHLPICALLAFASVGLAAAAPAARPNILVIVSDDQGYADTGFQGSKDIPTPHLDRLARSGIRFTNGYVSHPFCSPTRAALMTGRYQQRFGHERNPFYDPSDHREGLPTAESLLPEHLVRGGYRTGWVGKWHLGAAPEFAPPRRGFQETYGFIGGGHRYLNWEVNPKVEYTVPLERNGTATTDVPTHLTGALGSEASAFIRRHASEPWFLYLAFNAPHTPLEPTAERLARFAGIENELRRKYAAQVSLMDDAIGTTLAALNATNQQQRTLIFFFSDNGGPVGINGSSNAPLRGAKGSVYEGGVRVPFVIAWPGRIAAGKTDHRIVSSLDVFATALAAGGVPLPATPRRDSVNLIPYLTGENAGSPHDRLFWRNGALLAVREGKWKLVRIAGQPDELYDLEADIAESRDLAASEPRIARQLVTALEAWNQELIDPVFEGPASRRAAKKAGGKKKG